MAYSRKLRDRAFHIWCLASSIEAVADQMQREFPAAKRIGINTIKRWKATDGWESRQDGVREIVRKAEDEQLADKLSKLQGKLEKTLENLFTAAIEIAPKTFGEAAYAAPGLLNQYAKLLGLHEGGDKLRPDQFRAVFSRVLKAMMTVPAFKQMMTDEIKGQLTAAVEAEFAQT